MDSRIKLKVLGISYSQVQSGAYALILAQVNGPYRIPVVIGAAEAQSIAMKMEGITPPRPMTHDLFVSFAHAFGVKLKEAFIYKFEDGIFSSELTFADEDRSVTIDSRTSDAIAIAMRTGAPIYTTRAIIDETGFVMEIKDADDSEGNDEDTSDTSHDEPRIENYAIEELERTLARHIEREEYEQAAKVAEILNRKRGNSLGDAADMTK